MRCHKIQKKLSAYLDGELDSKQKHVIKEHLDACQLCSADRARLERLDVFLDDGVRLSSDAYMLSRIHAGIKQTGRSLGKVWSSPQKSLAPVLVVAGLFLGVLLGIELNGLFEHTEPDAEPSTGYSYIDSNIFEPMPTGSITATYVSMDPANK